MIYLLFNEGYSASGGDAHIRVPLCEEAIRLARLLLHLFPAEPEIMGLVALLLLQHARAAARLDADGCIVLLKDQDRARWDRAMIAEGLVLVEKALRHRRPGPYQVQAAMAAVHAQAARAEGTDWEHMDRLYAILESLQASPVVTLNRAVAVSKIHGPAAALAMIEPLASRLTGYFHFFGVKGALLQELGRNQEARIAFDQAIALAHTPAEIAHIRQHLDRLSATGPESTRINFAIAVGPSPARSSSGHPHPTEGTLADHHPEDHAVLVVSTARPKKRQTPMSRASMSERRIVSEDEWLRARRALLVKEKEHMRAGDRLAAERRARPIVKVEKDYVFDAPGGEVSLADLFDGCSQLIIHHLMYHPDWEAACPGCSFQADHIEGPRPHLEHHDVQIVAVSRAPLTKLEAYKERMGWSFDWVSSNRSDFNYDFHVSFTKDQLAEGEVDYNFGTITVDPRYQSEELPGVSVFYKDPDGQVFHSYFDLRAGPRRHSRRQSQSRPHTKGAVRGGLPELAATPR